MKPTLDKNGRPVLRDDYRISSLNCGEEDFAIACMRSNLKYGKNQKREDVKSHHYIISFDPRDAPDNRMELNYFRDRLFDLLNDSEGMGIADLNADERSSLLTVRTEDGNIFEIVCRKAAGKEDGWTTAN